MIIDASYFYGQLSIPQITDAAVIANLNWFINEYEPKLLTNLLGYELYKFTVDNPSDADVLKLINGTDYGDNKHWNGLKFGTSPLKKSLIANYVYYWWMRNNMSQTTIGGEKESKAENAIGSSPRYKMVRAWNDMVEMNIQLRDYLNASLEFYPTYVDPVTSLHYLYPYRWNRVNDQTELYKIMSPFI